MGSSVSRNSFDYKECIKVPVIVGFDKDGTIVPIYVKIEGRKYKVEEYRTKTKFAGITEYYCSVSYNDITMPIELSYYRNESVWTIPARQVCQ